MLYYNLVEEVTKKILIIEDDEFIRELYTRQLKLAGFEVEGTSSGLAGKDLLDKNKYNLLMLDLNIPDFSGFQILDYLKEHPKDKLTILVLSNVAGDQFVDKALEKGASAFIIKSTYTPERVVEEVKSLIT